LNELFAGVHRGWSSGAIVPPEIVDAHTFDLFHQSARETRDVLFQRVCEDAELFLPGLLHPRTLATSFVRGIPLPDWRILTRRVFTWLRANDWGRALQPAISSNAHA
jgi:hypothetical protein